ncbi:MAG: hypothetical protein GXP62_09730 [Oligoflexia bacterium]|nr:hypothetical protein [Oligoflexia bacterium]
MVESLLFGEQAALQRAGCASTVAPSLRSTDFEDFWTTDENWLPTCSSVNAEKHGEPQPMPWWHEERHAKHYLEHLVGQNGGIYDETVGGVAAFSRLDWPGVPVQAHDLGLIRALFEDLGDFFGVPSPLPPGPSSCLTYPPRTARRNQLLLRNM